MSAGLFPYCLAAFVLGGAGMYAGSLHAEPERKQQRWQKFAGYFVITNAVLLIAAMGRSILAGFAAAVVCVGAQELFTALRSARELGNIARAGIWAGYATCGSGLVLFSLVTAGGEIQFAYLIVAVFDGFSQVCGQLFGSKPLAPSISPSKTVEGALGGALFAAGFAAVVRGLQNGDVERALVFSAAIVPAALAGDLTGSWIKRRAGIKDFSSALPGQGGVLDRFGSFLFAATVAVLIPLVRT